MSGTALRSTKLQVTRVLLYTYFSSTVYTLCKKKKQKTVFFSGLEKQLLFLKDQNAHEALIGNLAPRHPLRLGMHHLLGPNLLLYIPVRVF